MKKNRIKEYKVSLKKLKAQLDDSYNKLWIVFNNTIIKRTVKLQREICFRKKEISCHENLECASTQSIFAVLINLIERLIKMYNLEDLENNLLYPEATEILKSITIEMRKYIKHEKND